MMAAPALPSGTGVDELPPISIKRKKLIFLSTENMRKFYNKL